MRKQRRDSAQVVAEDLSTSPGLNKPIVSVDAGADILARPENLPSSSIDLRPPWSPEAIRVSLPLRLWNARCLILNGFANADVLDADIESREVSRRVQRVDDKFLADEDSSRAWVQLYGSDYGGTTLGPFKAVFTLIFVKPFVKPRNVFRFMWWQYFGNSLVNKEFKEKVWGIAPNRLAVIETAYLGQRKAVRLLEDGRIALQMVWNSARFPHLVEVPQHLDFKTVAPARTDGGENDVVMDAISLKRGDADDVHFPFDSRDDDFYFDPTTELGKHLKLIDFTPVTWQCMLNYGGVVKIYDEHGGGSPPAARGPSRKPARRPAARR